jgi:RNA polymerase sigma-70 factor (ECF subfamily)
MMEACVSERAVPEKHSNESTAALLIRVREGSKPAREELAGRYLLLLNRWAHGRVPKAARDLVDTEDLVQSTIMRALNNVGTFEPRGEGAFLGYLRQILMNQILDEARRAKRRPKHVELDPGLEATRSPSPLEEAIGRDRLERYEASLQQLGEAQREAVVLRLEMGMRYRDIAEALEVPSAEAARALVGRGMVHLARLMRDHNE